MTKKELLSVLVNSTRCPSILHTHACADSTCSCLVMAPVHACLQRWLPPDLPSLYQKLVCLAVYSGISYLSSQSSLCAPLTLLSLKPCLYLEISHGGKRDQSRPAPQACHVGSLLEPLNQNDLVLGWMGFCLQFWTLLPCEPIPWKWRVQGKMQHGHLTELKARPK